MVLNISTNNTRGLQPIIKGSTVTVKKFVELSGTARMEKKRSNGQTLIG